MVYLGMKCYMYLSFRILMNPDFKKKIIKYIYLFTGMLWTFLAIISLHALVSLVFLMGAMKVCAMLVSSYLILLC